MNRPAGSRSHAPPLPLICALCISILTVVTKYICSHSQINYFELVLVAEEQLPVSSVGLIRAKSICVEVNCRKIKWAFSAQNDLELEEVQRVE